MQSKADIDFEAFKAFHSNQLKSIGLPASLQRKLFQKLTFEDYDIGSWVKIIIDEENDATQLICTKPLLKESEVFLIDHAWTFNYRDAINTLKSNPALFERISKIVESHDKQPLPSPEEVKQTQTAEEAFAEAIANGGKVFNLDSLGIEHLSELGEFPETAEEISLFDNQIVNPKYVVDCLVPLPNLKALWLNNNPVVEACSNFHSISELMPNLEICNSILTAKAGAWAMLYYARDQGAKSLDEIK